MINVTKPFLPPIEEYQKYVQEIWDRNWLTNNGPLVNDLELKIKDYLGLDHFLFVSSGTMALQLAIKALGIKGEVITTPFSYVATTSSLVWEGCTPVFVDIDKDTFNIDATLIEEAITENTTAIVATHVYGNPCAIDEIDAIAKKHKLKVIYDAAHCFGTKYKGQSVLNYGDISTISFHATKVFHSTEGGGVVTKNANILKKLALLRNFGHNGPEVFEGVGINGKNSEFHAAMGLANLKYANQILAKRKSDHEVYDAWLNKLDLIKPKVSEESLFNYAYYPVVFQSEDDCEKVMNDLEKERIYARRYFYPVLTKLEYVENSIMLVADDISQKILCLPLFNELSVSEIDMICRIILRTIKYN
jgi:dTDP-4-amino-4,6-dideoxygalactose transaminase